MMMMMMMMMIEVRARQCAVIHYVYCDARSKL